MLNVQFQAVAQGEDKPKTFDAILAVKCLLRTMPSEDVSDIVKEVESDGNLITRYLRWHTGEIRFFRDLVLRYDDMKRMYNEAEDRKSKQALRKLVFLSREKRNLSVIKKGDGGFLPTAALAISYDEAMDLRTDAGIDLRKTAEAVRFCARMGIIALIIVDKVRNVMHVYDDGHYQTFDTIVLDEKKSEKKLLDQLNKNLLVGGRG